MSDTAMNVETSAAHHERPRAWQPGQSGNPAGRPKGSRNRSTLAVAEVLENDAGAVANALVALAKCGNLTALRMCMQRLVPPAQNRVVAFDLPTVASAADAARAQAAVLQALAAGELAPSEAVEVSRVVDAAARAFQRAEEAEADRTS
jgi:hypothetical protein